MFQFHVNVLPSAFNNFFNLAKNRHCHNTVSKQSFCLPRVKTNYGKFSLRYLGPLIWNDIDTSVKTKSKIIFKSKLIEEFLRSIRLSIHVFCWCFVWVLFCILTVCGFCLHCVLFFIILLPFFNLLMQSSFVFYFSTSLDHTMLQILKVDYLTRLTINR